MIKSIYESQEEILQSIIDLYCVTGFQADASYGNGVFYKNIVAPEYKYDIDPQTEDTLNHSSENLPLEDSFLNNLVFDPPFLTYIRNGRTENKSIMATRFSGYWTYDELTDHYKKSLEEFHRVLRHKGILVFKCQDIIHNHKMHCTHNNVINWAGELGFRLKDLFVLKATHRMPSPQKGVQKHARIFHSYFLIFENWKRK